MKYRIEKDSIGVMQIPQEVYYGIYTSRGKQNSDITKRDICRQLIKSLAIVKKACAKANLDCGNLTEDVANAIMQACDEILIGKLHGQFIVDVIQGGGGTAINMNANEVIANRACEILGGKKGQYELCHPLDHVNRSQSTNDVLPTAGKIAVIKQVKKLSVELKKLIASLDNKAEEFKDIYKVSRTHLQDNVPITLGQEFQAYSVVLQRDYKRLNSLLDILGEVNLGGAEIGTSLNNDSKYLRKVILNLNHFSGEDLKAPKDYIESTRNFDSFLTTSSTLKTLATNISKIAKDIKLMSSSMIEEIELPLLQIGSSTTPGKQNAIISEVVTQTSYYVYGLDTTITLACQDGELELNPNISVILMSLFEQLSSLRHAIRLFNNSTIQDLKANADICKESLLKTKTTGTLLIKYLGYDLACSLVEEANRVNKPLRDVVVEKNLLTKEQIDQIDSVYNTLFTNNNSK